MGAVFLLVSLIFYILIRIVAHSFFEKHFEKWPLSHRWDSRGYMNGTSSWYRIVSFWIDCQEVLGVQEATKIRGIKHVKYVRKIESPCVNKQFRVKSIGTPRKPAMLSSLASSNTSLISERIISRFLNMGSNAIFKPRTIESVFPDPNHSWLDFSEICKRTETGY